MQVVYSAANQNVIYHWKREAKAAYHQKTFIKWPADVKSNVNAIE